MLLTNRKAIWENSLGNALRQPEYSKPGTVTPGEKKKKRGAVWRERKLSALGGLSRMWAKNPCILGKNWSKQRELQLLLPFTVLVCSDETAPVQSKNMASLAFPADALLPSSGEIGNWRFGSLPVQFCLHCCWPVPKSSLTLCDPVERRTPGFPVLYHFPEPAQTLVHRVGDAIQPSYPLSSPSPPVLNLSQHQGLF